MYNNDLCYWMYYMSNDLIRNRVFYTYTFNIIRFKFKYFTQNNSNTNISEWATIMHKQTVSIVMRHINSEKF